MQVSRPIVVIAVSAMFAVVPIVGCSGASGAPSPGGTLPPILTTTTLSATETTLAPFVEVYRLKPGDNVGTVSAKFNVPQRELIKANPDTLGDNPSNLPVGTEIIIPPHRYIETLPPSPTTVPPS